MPCIGMAYLVMAYIVMAYIVMARTVVKPSGNQKWGLPARCSTLASSEELSCLVDTSIRMFYSRICVSIHMAAHSLLAC